MTRRTLSLKRETLTELAGDDLRAVVGAGDLSGGTCPRILCVVDVSDLFHTCGCQSSPC